MGNPREELPGGGGRSPWAYAGLGFDLAVPPLVGMYVGHRLDRWLETSPWLLLLGAVLGMVVGFYGFIRTVLPEGKGR